MLEQIRKNPIAYAQLLATEDKLKKGGSQGMFSYWQRIAKSIHSEELTISQGILKLENLFLTFNDNVKNKNRQTGLLKHLPKYCNEYKRMQFEFVDSKKFMQWDILPEVKLSGYTSWIVKNKTSFYSYFPLEKNIDWQAELRFPLIQNYLATNILECDSSELQIGIYSLESSSFEFKSFNKTEIEKAINETKIVFHQVFEEYEKKKPKVAAWR
ncbi:hypothetical protein [Ferruginibacter albus]|uniref:hypothetical protein n=1 Tax=Ferruginibacter albus TaxID=2875540 RepID=UPI001CC55EDB|nr:hypothetical protein [Ferruginibacter albus]UAY52735.1 hypothetical protein K9M53_03345 [Ferruginibacter albus]